MDSYGKDESVPFSPTHAIENVTFTSNEAYAGGALYVKGVDYLKITNTTFSSNLAITAEGISQSGNGGAIAFDTSDEIVKLELDSSVIFNSNNAKAAGGAIYWNYVEPYNIDSPTFTDNTASSYGDNVACFAQQLIQVTESEYNSAQGRRVLSDYAGTNSLSLSDQASGGELPDLYLSLVDQYGQNIGTDETSTATLNINTTGTTSDYTPVLSGTTTVAASNGMFMFTGVTFTAEPGSTFNLYITTTGIDISKPSNEEYWENVSKASASVDLKVSLREWVEGEVLLATGEWDECEGPSEYSLEIMTSTSSCETCPTDKATCLGGSNIGPNPGYWRSSNTTDNFIECLYYYACNGFVEPDYEPTGECASGYQGILWADWEVGYSRTGDYQWSKCPDKIWNIIRIILVLLAVTVLIMIIIKSTLDGAVVRKNLQSVYMKILMNHLQLVLLTASFNFDWPDDVTDFYDTTRPASQVSQQVLSFDWFLDQRSESDDSNSIKLYYQKMIMYAILPLLLMLGSTLFWAVFYWIKSSANRDKKNGRIIASIIILLFLVHPNIVQYMFNNFNWMAIDDDQRMVYDLNVVCWEGEHFTYSFFIAVPSILIWGFGIPLFAWIWLYRNKADLEEIEWREKFGFLYNGYKQKWYFWESINMYRKITIIFIAVFLDVAGVITQALVVFLVLIVFLYFNIKLQPYAFKDLNDMEAFSILTSMLTVYWGLYYLSDMPEIYNSSDNTVQSADNGLRLNSTAKLFLFLVILISNLLFFIFWTYKMIGEIKNMMRSKFRSWYLYLFWCGNKDRMEKQIRDRAMKDQHDVLWEKLEIQLEEIKNAYRTGKLLLNDVVIQKSAAYLKIDKYIEAVKDKSKPAVDSKNKNRLRMTKNKRLMLKESERRLDVFDSPFFKNTKSSFEMNIGQDSQNLASNLNENNDKSRMNLLNSSKSNLFERQNMPDNNRIFSRMTDENIWFETTPDYDDELDDEFEELSKFPAPKSSKKLIEARTKLEFENKARKLKKKLSHKKKIRGKPRAPTLNPDDYSNYKSI